MKTSDWDSNQDGFSKFYAKSKLIRPDDLAHQFKAAFFPAAWHGDGYDISLWQEQIRFNKGTFAAQIFNETFVDAVAGRKK